MRIERGPPNPGAAGLAGARAEQARNQLLDEACLIHPTLQHRRLSHDFLAAGRLTELLPKPSGTTLIQGSPAHIRTFLIAALGNSFNQAHPGAKPVAGLDIHLSESMAPVIGVTNSSNPVNMSRTAKRL